MLDQLIIGDKASYDDFEASVRERAIHAPKKKRIKESVPFSNVTHDFSAINGEIYWDERMLEYIFEITACSAEELEEKKQAFCNWIMSIHKGELFDPFVHDYHFEATYSDMVIDCKEIEKATITVQFTAYPYMIANDKKVFTFEIGETIAPVTVYNHSSHRIIPTITTDVDCTIFKGNATFGKPAGSMTSEKFMLEMGANELEVVTFGGSGTLKFEFYEEVF